MTLTIDAEKVELPPLPEEKFKTYLDRVADHLLKVRRCIGTCVIDGQPLQTLEQGEPLFSGAKELMVESVPLAVALQANIALQCNAVRQIESKCETLVTDSLLAEPKQVAASWSTLCDSVKGVLKFIPVLNGLLTKEQVDHLVDQRLTELNSVMKEIQAALGKGDVVTFSDLLEMKLLPWLGGLREFFQAQLTLVESLAKTEKA